MNSLPLWSEATTLPLLSSLRADLEAGVVVIGAGIAGMTAALRLQRAGKQVVVLDGPRVISERASTPVQLTELIDAGHHVLETKFGHKLASMAATSSRVAIDCVEAFVRGFGRACGFERVPLYVHATTEDERQELEREFNALKRAGTDVSWVDTFSSSTNPLTAAIRIERQAKIEAAEYLKELTGEFVRAGGQLFADTEVLAIEGGEACSVQTRHAKVFADDVLVLTNTREPCKGLPFVGQRANTKHVYVATGLSDSQVTWATLAAIVLTDTVRGVPSAWAELYDGSTSQRDSDVVH